jgi:hypothetical protein
MILVVLGIIRTESQLILWLELSQLQEQIGKGDLSTLLGNLP